MHENKTDFTITFRSLSNGVLLKEGDENIKKLFNNSNTFNKWFLKWQDRLSRQEKKLKDISNLMKKVNPLIIPRNHLVEEAILEAELNEDFTYFENLVNALKNPFDEIGKYKKYLNPPNPDEEVLKTFCGT